MHKAHIGVDAEPPLLNVAECIPTESTASMNVAGAKTERTVWLYLLKSLYISTTVLQYLSLQYLHTITQLILCSFIYLYMK